MKNYLIAICCMLSFSAAAQYQVGDTIPAFSMKSIEGHQIESSWLKGHPMIIDFWASWCWPCKIKMPMMADAARPYMEKGLLVVTVATNDRDADWRKSAEKLKILDFINLFDTDRDAPKTKKSLLSQMGFNALPTTLLVDAEGKILLVNPKTAALESALYKMFRQKKG
jgi:thiol-disulfide isomerase/thioredoxin